MLSVNCLNPKAQELNTCRDCGACDGNYREDTNWSDYDE